MIWTTENWPRHKLPNFAHSEFVCSHCGANEMDEVFLDALQFLRTRLGRVMPVTSGYRCAEHPIEAAKAQPGAHAHGKAADIRCKSGTYGYELVEKSIGLFTGIGISLSPGKAQYIHLDCIRPGEGHWTRPVMWSY